MHLKMSGVGTKIEKRLNVVNFAYTTCILCEKENAMSEKGNYVLVITVAITRLQQICDIRSFGSCRIKGTDKSLSRVDSSVPLMRHDTNDLRSQIRFRILPKNVP